MQRDRLPRHARSRPSNAVSYEKKPFCSHSSFTTRSPTVRKRVFLRHFVLFKDASFYQDRLGTNTGKPQKEMRFYRRWQKDCRDNGRWEAGAEKWLANSLRFVSFVCLSRASLGKSAPILWFKLKETAAACSQEPAVAQGPQPSPPPNSYAAQDDGNEIKPPSANVIVAVCMPMCESARLTKCLPGYSLSLARSGRRHLDDCHGAGCQLVSTIIADSKATRVPATWIFL